ncbi:hypothetical protein TNCV_76141 [Trichonephila clavipes]|nr:hypothetical protein TNCV_76141 [Trichonephila clavipes]
MPEPDEISNMIKEVVDLAGHINLGVDNDNIQELLDSLNQDLTIDELLEMHEQEQNIEELLFRPSSIRKSSDGFEFDRNPLLIEKWLQNIDYNEKRFFQRNKE